MGLKSDIVLNLFKQDLEGEKRSKNLLLVLPAGKAAHIESGIAYGMGKKYYAIGEYEATDTLYNIINIDSMGNIRIFTSCGLEIMNNNKRSSACWEQI